MDNVQNLSNLSNVWEMLNKDLKLLILTSLPIDDRLNFCQSDRRISNFCRENNLTGYDATIQTWNPSGELIDSKAKLAEYIERGYDTVYSLLLTEFDDEDVDNPRDLRDINIIGIIPGVNKGTVYINEITEYRDSYHFYHFSMPGLPPSRGTTLKIIAFIYYDFGGMVEIDAYEYRDEEELYQILSSETMIPDNFKWKYNGEDVQKLKKQGSVLDAKYVDYDGNVRNSHKIALYELPCP